MITRQKGSLTPSRAREKGATYPTWLVKANGPAVVHEHPSQLSRRVAKVPSAQLMQRLTRFLMPALDVEELRNRVDFLSPLARDNADSSGSTPHPNATRVPFALTRLLE